MAMLAVWRYDSPGGADEAAVLLEKVCRDLTIVQDAATVWWEEGEKKPRTRQLSDVADADALGSDFWGLLFGMVFFIPLIGAALGAATGALAGSLSDIGIDDQFINRIRDEVTPGTSALFVMASDGDLDTIKTALDGRQASQLLFTNLRVDQEAALREVFVQ